MNQSQNVSIEKLYAPQKLKGINTYVVKLNYFSTSRSKKSNKKNKQETSNPKISSGAGMVDIPKLELPVDNKD